jgi:hypothetical protein
MFRLTAGETWLDGLELMDPDTGKLNYGTAIFINRRSLARPSRRPIPAKVPASPSARSLSVISPP